MTTHRISSNVALIALFALAVLALAAGALAQTAGSGAGLARATLADPPLEAVVAEALERNSDLAVSVAAAEAARFRIEPAQTLPDPFVSLTYQNDGWAFSLGERDMTFLGAVFAQPLPWPGKLRLAGEEAALRAEEASAGMVGRARLTLEGQVRRAYFEFLQDREDLALIQERGRSWREIADIVRERYAVGLGAQQDLLRTQTEVLRLDEARTDQEARLENRRAELNRLLGRPQESAIETDQQLELRPQVPDLPALLAAVRERSPELAALSRRVEADASRVQLAGKQFLPDFVASGGPMYRGGLEPMWQVGLGISLPIHAASRLKPLQAAADAELRSDRSRLSSAGLELELKTRQRYQNLDASLRVAGLYRDGILPTDQLSLESAIASYRSGKVPFVTVLEALNTLYADRGAYLARLADAEKWRASIDEADLRTTAPMSTGPAEGAEGPPAPMSGAAAAMQATAGMR